jgi:hypothetical protein
MNAVAMPLPNASIDNSAESSSNTSTEESIASLAVALLRDGGMSDEDILKRFTKVSAQVDRTFEDDYYREHGVTVSAKAIKQAMRAIVTQ